MFCGPWERRNGFRVNSKKPNQILKRALRFIFDIVIPAESLMRYVDWGEHTE